MQTESMCDQRVKLAQSGATCEQQGGSTLRDYFAAAALQGLMAHSRVLVHPKTAAWHAYQHADAMLAERESGRVQREHVQHERVQPNSQSGRGSTRGKRSDDPGPPA